MKVKRALNIKGYSVYSDVKTKQYIEISIRIKEGFKNGHVDCKKIVDEINSKGVLKPYKIDYNGVLKVYSHLLKILKT